MGFCSLLPELSGEQFSLLPCKPCHSGVIWTEEKADNSEFTLSAAWFKPLHKVLQCQNILKTHRNKQAKIVFLPPVGFFRMEERLFFLSFHMIHARSMQLTNHIYYTIKLHYSVLLCG